MEERKQEEEKNTTLFMRECMEVMNRTLDESVPKCGQSIERLLVDHGNVGGEGTGQDEVGQGNNS